MSPGPCPAQRPHHVHQQHNHEKDTIMGMIKEFREFALKGNVLDLAVGVIIGAAFGKIVTSMIEDVIMPFVGMFGNVDFSNMYFPLGSKVREEVSKAYEAGIAAPSLIDARKLGPVFAYGNFITVAINFIILAFCIFMVVKVFNTARKRLEAEKPAPPPPGPSAEEKLLGEIRDILKSR
jgi:large conductance mechanosensitive channel